MSKATAAARFPDGEIRWCIYNGTTDTYLSKLSPTHDAAWSTPEHGATCTDPNHIHEPVDLATSYGGGWHSTGKACRKCMCITAGAKTFDLDDDQEKEGLPDWWSFVRR